MPLYNAVLTKGCIGTFSRHAHIFAQHEELEIEAIYQVDLPSITLSGSPALTAFVFASAGVCASSIDNSRSRYSIHQPVASYVGADDLSGSPQIFGYETVDEYYDAASSVNYIQSIHNPSLRMASL
jgi:hypothetical protein